MMILTYDNMIINTNSVNKIYVERKLVPNSGRMLEQFYVYADGEIIDFFPLEEEANACVNAIFSAMEEGLTTWSVKIFKEMC
jgi:hypothetical protein